MNEQSYVSEGLTEIDYWNDVLNQPEMKIFIETWRSLAEKINFDIDILERKVVPPSECAADSLFYIIQL